MLESVLISQGLFLVRAGVLNDLQVASVKQDDANPDTIQVELSLLVKYPVNYIKIKMVF
jgi:SAM-dependent MidA family methyltransferase